MAGVGVDAAHGQPGQLHRQHPGEAGERGLLGAGQVGAGDVGRAGGHQVQVQAVGWHPRRPAPAPGAARLKKPRSCACQAAPRSAPAGCAVQRERVHDPGRHRLAAAPRPARRSPRARRARTVNRRRPPRTRAPAPTTTTSAPAARSASASAVAARAVGEHQAPSERDGPRGRARPAATPAPRTSRAQRLRAAPRRRRGRDGRDRVRVDPVPLALERVGRQRHPACAGLRVGAHRHPGRPTARRRPRPARPGRRPARPAPGRLAQRRQRPLLRRAVATCIRARPASWRPGPHSSSAQPLAVGEQRRDAVAEPHRPAQVRRPVRRVGGLLGGDPVAGDVGQEPARRRATGGTAAHQRGELRQDRVHHRRVERVRGAQLPWP